MFVAKSQYLQHIKNIFTSMSRTSKHLCKTTNNFPGFYASFSRWYLEQHFSNSTNHVQGTILLSGIHTGIGQHRHAKAHGLVQNLLTLGSGCVEHSLRRHHRGQEILKHIWTHKTKGRVKTRTSFSSSNASLAPFSLLAALEHFQSTSKD